jgi:2-polyprenyl-6-methoxyphenol hydroxylase-like FAD-dependent oxidoreductase
MALALAHQGVDVRIVDSAPSLHREARASALHARTLEVLAPLGVSERLSAHAHAVHRVRFFGPDAREILCRTLGAIDSPYPPMQNLEQWRTEALLADQCAARGVLVERSSEFLRAEQGATGVVSWIAREGRESALRARFLVGCDGARSAVRRSLGVRLEETGSVAAGASHGDYPERWIAGELRLAGDGLGREARILFETDRVALEFPLHGGALFFATLRDDEIPGTTHGAVDPGEVHRVYGRAFGRHAALRGEIASVPWSSAFAMHHCAAREYRSGRIFLAGDAAHLTSAAGGSGMNAGLQDAVNLAWRLAAHLRMGVAERILDGYSVDRHEAFEAIDARSDAAHRLLVAHDPNAFSGARPGGLRALVARFLSPAPEGAGDADRELAETSDRLARHASFVDLVRPNAGSSATGAVRPGMRVPPLADFSMDRGGPRPFSALFDGLHWTLVVAVESTELAPAAEVAALDALAVARLSGRVRTVVAAGDAFRWNAPNPTVFAVRPDGIMAFRADSECGRLPSPSLLAEWFDAFLPRG